MNMVDPSGEAAAGCHTVPGEGANSWTCDYTSPPPGPDMDFITKSARENLSQLKNASIRASNSAPIYLSNRDCFKSGLLLRAGGDAIVDVAGAGVAIGGTGAVAGTALGLFGSATGNVPAAGIGAIIAGPSAKLAELSAMAQGGGALISFLGGTSSRALVKNGSAAIIDRIPVLPSPAKAAIKQAAKYGSNFVPDVRTCNRGY